MRASPVFWAVSLSLAACGADEGGGVTATCDEVNHRAVASGPFTCGGAPAFVTVEHGGRRFDLFTYEASHPTASATQAFPCAVSRGFAFEAPEATTEACSVAGVRPWHSVRWGEAQAACAAIGWRLCTAEELTRACQGPRGSAYTYGSTFDAGKCNLRDAYRAPGAELASEAPTGELEACVSAEGAYDLTGNVREWTDERASADADARFNQGGGWRTVAEAHREANLRCDVSVRVPGATASYYASADVGFRCCRDTP